MTDPVYILGAGMHPWGKWGRDFTEYGVVAARAALRDAGVDWRQIQLVAGADTIRNGYPGFVAGATAGFQWAGRGFGPLEADNLMRWTIASTTAIVVGGQIVLTSFLRYLIENALRRGGRPNESIRTS